MAYIEVDIELDEFETEEIVRELKSRVGKYGRKGMGERQEIEFKKAIKDVIGEDAAPAVFPVESLDDKMKVEHLQKVWSKYTWAQVMDLLPE